MQYQGHSAPPQQQQAQPSNLVSATLAPPGSKRCAVKEAVKGVIGPEASRSVGNKVSVITTGLVTKAAVGAITGGSQQSGQPGQQHGVSQSLAPPGSKRAALKGLVKDALKKH